MILAAGYGTRLAPLTDLVCKPLLPVEGRTLLDQAVDSLEGADVRQFAVNTHHLGQQVADHLAQRPDHDRFFLFPEDPIQGTGGALYGARDFLAASPYFLVHNGDVLCDADLGALVQDHLAHGALATLLLTDWPAVNSVALDSRGQLVRIGRGGEAEDPDLTWHTYTGIAVFDRAFLQGIGPGFSSLIDPLVRARNHNPGCVRGYAPGGFVWSDLGTPARYLDALKGGTAMTPLLRVERITGHGSTRRFWRLGNADTSLVAMVSDAEDQEFTRFVEIGRWLEKAGLGAPHIFSVNEAEHSVVMEDVGADRLYERAVRRDPGLAEAYGLALDHLLRLQAATEKAAVACPLAMDRSLDHAQLRWETDYFRDRFLVGHCGLEPADLEDLTPEFESLARTVARQPQVLIHRDFQSQNIHVQTGGRIRLVDFQGLRRGPVGYDIMSLVMDPYVGLSPELRQGLVDDFCRRASTGHDPHQVQAMAVCAGLQRIMQALGAYGFLGNVRGKPEFLRHIPRALDHLQELLDWLGGLEQAGKPVPGTWLPDQPLKMLRRLAPRLG